MREPLVSVIVPVYNGEKIVRTAVDSISNQTLTDLEIIVVDDGSTDGTGAVLEELAAADARIKVVRQENQGSYNARTNGIKIATGKYFTSVDADDTIEPAMLEEMASLAERENLDVVECDLSVDTDESGQIDIYKSIQDTREKFIEPALICGTGFMCVCGKLYRREQLFDDVRKKHILKQRVTLFEDMLFNFQILDTARSYGRIHKPFYNYYISAASSVRNFKAQNIEGFDFVLRTRDRLSGNYGIEPGDARMSLWTLKNAKNMMMLAAYAHQDSLATNVANFKALKDLESVRAKWRSTNKANLPRGLRLFYSAVYALPASLAVVLIKLIKRFV